MQKLLQELLQLKMKLLIGSNIHFWQLDFEDVLRFMVVQEEPIKLKNKCTTISFYETE